MTAKQCLKPRVTMSGQISTPIEFFAISEIDVVEIIEDPCVGRARTEAMQERISLVHPDTGTIPPNLFSIIARQR